MSTSKTDLSPADLSVQTNVVTITDNSNTITGISYVENSLVITPGQPSTPPPTVGQFQNSFTITLMAGREDNSEVASSFNSVAGGAFNEYAASGDDSGTPSQLNFYFAVQISYKSEGNPGSVVAYLGQGSFGSFIDPTNNWWIGGSCIANNPTSSGNEPTIQLGGGEFSLSGTQDSFVVA
ncbi:MAG TPA: hypothetical protein VN844_10405 [Pyrinomonadaceae bacterium]|nr:hypothetical protein [Pyrinomonadaceae bacterium]